MPQAVLVQVIAPGTPDVVFLSCPVPSSLLYRLLFWLHLFFSIQHQNVLHFSHSPSFSLFISMH